MDHRGLHHHALTGFVEVICGSMFSGKTEELLRRLKRAQFARQKVQVFKPSVDTRYSQNHVTSHDSSQVESIPIKNASELLEFLDPSTRVVGIDEAQFFDREIIRITEELAYRGMRVIVAGLDLDFKGKPFGAMPELLALAESVTKLTAVCAVCGAPATRSQRIAQIESEPGDVLLGSTESYEPRCRFCHEPRALDVGRGLKFRTPFQSKQEQSRG